MSQLSSRHSFSRGPAAALLQSAGQPRPLDPSVIASLRRANSSKVVSSFNQPADSGFDLASFVRSTFKKSEMESQGESLKVLDSAVSTVRSVLRSGQQSSGEAFDLRLALRSFDREQLGEIAELWCRAAAAHQDLDDSRHLTVALRLWREALEISQQPGFPDALGRFKLHIQLGAALLSGASKQVDQTESAALADEAREHFRFSAHAIKILANAMHAEKLEKDPAVIYQLVAQLSATAERLNSLGHHRAALRLSLTSTRLAKQTLGYDDSSTLESKAGVAYGLAALGSHKKAAEIASGICRSSNFELLNVSDQLKALTVYADSSYRTQDWSAVEWAREEAIRRSGYQPGITEREAPIELQEQMLMPLISIVQTLACLRRYQGAWSEARTFADDALLLAQATNGKHPKLVMRLGLLAAEMWECAGRESEAQHRKFAPPDRVSEDVVPDADEASVRLGTAERLLQQQDKETQECLVAIKDEHYRLGIRANNLQLSQRHAIEVLALVEKLHGEHSIDRLDALHTVIQSCLLADYSAGVERYALAALGLARSLPTLAAEVVLDLYRTLWSNALESGACGDAEMFSDEALEYAREKGEERSHGFIRALVDKAEIAISQAEAEFQPEQTNGKRVQQFVARAQSFLRQAKILLDTGTSIEEESEIYDPQRTLAGTRFRYQALQGAGYLIQAELLDDPQSADEARKAFLSAVRDAKKANLIDDLPGLEALVGLARSYILLAEHGRSPERYHEFARKQLVRAVRGFQELGSDDLAYFAEALELLIEVYERTGKGSSDIAERCRRRLARFNEHEDKNGGDEER